MDNIQASGNYRIASRSECFSSLARSAELLASRSSASSSECNGVSRRYTNELRGGLYLYCRVHFPKNFSVGRVTLHLLGRMKVDAGDAHTILVLIPMTGQFRGHVDTAIALIEEEPQTPGSLAYALDLSPNYIQRLIKVVLAAKPGFKLDYITDPETGNHTP